MRNAGNQETSSTFWFLPSCLPHSVRCSSSLASGGGMAFWIIGIDEAGYGPNLGPLVMTSVACRVPDKLTGTDLWQALRLVVRRCGESCDAPLLVDDSKAVYGTAQGLKAL